MNRSVLKLTALALLAAIGVVLMSIFQIPYPVAPFLKIEFSDFVVIFAFLLFGFKEAFVVSILKTLCDLLIRGPQTGGALPFVAHLTALVASLSYVFVLWICSKIFKGNKIKDKIIGYSAVVLIVSVIMTFLNYMILTPLFLGEVSFFGSGLSSSSAEQLASLTGVDSFLLGMIILYMPFNLLKGTCIALVAVTSGDTLLTMYRNKFKLKDKRYEEIT